MFESLTYLQMHKFDSELMKLYNNCMKEAVLGVYHRGFENGLQIQLVDQLIAEVEKIAAKEKITPTQLSQILQPYIELFVFTESDSVRKRCGLMLTDLTQYGL